MNIAYRSYRNEYDYFQIRDFLCKTILLHDRRQINWPLYRWDYWRWHVNKNIFRFKLDESIFIWETDENAIAAVLNRSAPGEAFLQIHPRHRNMELVDEMVQVAEQRFTFEDEAGHSRLVIGVHESDTVLKTCLSARGFQRGDETEYQRWQLLNQPILPAPIPDGYILRCLGETAELPARSWASWRVFHPNEPTENYKGWEWYLNVQRIPTYRRELDLVAVTPAGGVAAFVTIWYDEATRTGAFEPVGCMPEHQRKGLSKALLTDGLRKLRELGAAIAYVSSYTPAAHAAYESVGFRDFELCEMWVKES